MSKHLIINGDSRQMDHLENGSVQLAITSPPYWQLKDYGTTEQIGFFESYESYINNLNLVWKECYRVLEDGCRLCINIGDQFARAVYYGRYKVIPIRTEIIKFCEAIGFDYMGAIIWQKRTTTNTSGGASLMGSYPFPRNGVISIDYEFILLFKKLGKPRKVEKEIKEQSRMTKEEWKEYFNGHWNFGGARQDGHIAMFPEELPKRLIKMFSFANETVLDPFAGSGTTSLAAHNLGRNSVGFELNPEFIPFVEKKLASAEFEIQKQVLKTDFEKAKAELPYIFKDFHNLKNKIDPRKKQFGSKINSKSEQREEYFSVKEIISPTLLKLKNGETIRLLGLQEKKGAQEAAIDFLKLKTGKSRVYLKYDEEKRDKDNHLLCYLYLKNKTFINAHLIKRGLAEVDEQANFKLKEKFLKLQVEQS